MRGGWIVGVFVVVALQGLLGASRAEARGLDLIEELRIEVGPMALIAVAAEAGAYRLGGGGAGLETAQRYRAQWDVGMMALQVLGELAVSLAVGLVAVGVVLALVGTPAGDVQTGVGILVVALILGGLASLVVMPLAVWLVGKWMGGRGTFAGAFLGNLAGIGVSVLLSLLVSVSPEVGTILSLFSLAISLAAPIVGYHLSWRGSGMDVVRKPRPEAIPERRRRLLALSEETGFGLAQHAVMGPALVRF